jgi:hypothetical protein
VHAFHPSPHRIGRPECPCHRCYPPAIEAWRAPRIAVLAILCLGMANNASAQTNNSYPMLMSLRPTATLIGASTEHELSARYNLAGATAVLVSGSGVTGEILPNDAEKPEDKARNDVMNSKCKLRFTCTPNTTPGIRDFRIMTPHGVSTVGQLVIAREPIVLESAENDRLDQSQSIPLPATLCGAIEKAEDIDFYRFHVDQPSALTFHMTSQRLQNRLHDMQTRVDPVITLRTATGTTLAASDNHFAGDPLLHVTLDRPGDYLLEVRDVRYQGNADWSYAIEASARPFPTMTHPLAVPAGEATTVELRGLGLPPNATTSLQPPVDSADSIVRLAPSVSDVPLSSVLVWSTRARLIPEASSPQPSATTAADGTPLQPIDTPTPVAAPCVITGRLEQPTEVDRYRFTAKANERFTFEVLARRLGSNLDAKLRILNESDTPLIEVDDTTFDRLASSDPMIENWTAPADGMYTIELRDLHGRGGLDFPYAIRLTSARPYFVLEADTDKTLLAPNTSGVLYVKALRRNGFAGEIQLAIDGLPSGVDAVCGRILANGSDGAIWLRGRGDAPTGIGNVRISGVSTLLAADGSQETLLATASTMQEIYMPGGGRGHYPVDAHTVSVAQPMDIRNIAMSSTHIELKPGGSQRIEVTVERSPEYRGNVTLDLMLQHLEQPYGNPLPKGVTIDGGASKTLLTGTESVGYITLKAAADAPPVAKHLVPITVHVSINFVMKHTFSGDPVFISVLPP